MKCPKCGGEMIAKRCGITVIYICPRCNRKFLEEVERNEDEFGEVKK